MENATPVAPVERLVMPLSFGSLFAGIGGFDLGFERAGMVCKWQVEIDNYANRVLAKHWPDVRRWPDVRTWPQPDTERVDVICGGFPCTDISSAGSKAGINGNQSGLWRELRRVVCELRPRFVVVENVAALLVRGIGTVCGDLAEIGYDTEWESIPAAAVGAPHIRDRVFILAYPRDEGAYRITRNIFGTDAQDIEKQSEDRIQFVGESGWWKTESTLDRVADGFPGRVDRLRCLGNSVVPQVAEWIGRRIIEAVESAA